MTQLQLYGVEKLSDGYQYNFQGQLGPQVADAVEQYFLRVGYKRENGEPGNATYGRGSDFLRVMFGGFVKRYKFNATVAVEGGFTMLRVQKGMSGAMGGVMGHSSMTKETNKVMREIRDTFLGGNQFAHELNPG